MDEHFQDSDVFFSDDCSAHINSTFENQEMMNPLLSCGKLAEIYDRSQNHTPKHCSISVTIESQSSICVASPPSANQPQNKAIKELIAAPPSNCRMTKMDMNKILILSRRRKLSNRESARRSRKRKLAHLTELESLVVNLQGENESLYNHLTEATQLYGNADTNHRALKSEVEALRAKVKLTKDTVARCSLSYSLNQLLQNHLNAEMEPPLSNVDGASYGGITASGQNSDHRLGGRDTSGKIDGVESSMGSDDFSF